MSSSSKAEVKQYTAHFSGSAAELTVDHLSGILESATYDPDTKSYVLERSLLVNRFVVPVGAHIINGTDSDQRIGNRITAIGFQMKAIIRNTEAAAPCLKLSLIHDNGINGGDKVNTNDIYSAYSGLSGNVINTIPRLSGTSRFKILKSSVIEVYNEASDSVAYLSWDITMAMNLIYRRSATNDTSGLTSCNTGLYLLVSLGADSLCTLEGTYSLLYTDA